MAKISKNVEIKDTGKTLGDLVNQSPIFEDLTSKITVSFGYDYKFYRYGKVYYLYFGADSGREVAANEVFINIPSQYCYSGDARSSALVNYNTDRNVVRPVTLRNGGIFCYFPFNFIAFSMVWIKN